MCLVYFIIADIAIGLLYIYAAGLSAMPISLVLLGCNVVLGLSVWIICINSEKSAFRPTEQQNTAIKEAKQRDDANRSLNAAMEAKATREAERRKQDRIDACTRSITQLEKQLAEMEQKLRRVNILGPDEQNIYAVEQLIGIMESRRADSLKEALRVYDEQQSRRAAAAIAQYEANARLLDEKWRRQEQFERDMAEVVHRSRMERLAQEQADAIERKRKDDDYYRRYGTSR